MSHRKPITEYNAQNTIVLKGDINSPSIGDEIITVEGGYKVSKIWDGASWGINGVFFPFSNSDGNERGITRLSSPTSILIETADQYYKIPGTWGDTYNNNFTTDASNKITYNGTGGTFSFFGVSELSVDKACQTTYGMKVNGVLDTGNLTKHTFPASSRISTIAIIGIVDLSSLDEIEIFATSTVANTTIGVDTLRVMFWKAM